MIIYKQCPIHTINVNKRKNNVTAAKCSTIDQKNIMQLYICIFIHVYTHMHVDICVLMS